MNAFEVVHSLVITCIFCFLVKGDSCIKIRTKHGPVATKGTNPKLKDCMGLVNEFGTVYRSKKPKNESSTPFKMVGNFHHNN